MRGMLAAMKVRIVVRVLERLFVWVVVKRKWM
jgi:hypothetical protein